MNNYTKHFDHLPSKNCQINKLNKCLCTNDNITHLDFSFNSIRRLRGGTFKNTTEFVFLDLTHNFIDYIGIRAFVGLQKLQALDLSLNHFKAMTENGLFSPLKSLTVLDASHGLDGLKESLIPALSDLHKLKKLTVTIPIKDSISFPALNNLTELVLTTPSQVLNLQSRKHEQNTIISPIFGHVNSEINIRRGFFQFAANTLQYISLPGSCIGDIENGTFSNLTLLKVLDFSQRDMLLPITNVGTFTTELFQNSSGIYAVVIYLCDAQITRELSQEIFKPPNLKTLLRDKENIINIWKFGPAQLNSASCTVLNWEILRWEMGSLMLVYVAHRELPV